MTKQEIEEYKKDHGLTSDVLIANHIKELKRNTKPNLELISSLATDLYPSPSFIDEVIEHAEFLKNSIYKQNNIPFDLGKRCSTQCFCDGSCKKENTLFNSTRHKSKNGLFHKEVEKCGYTMCGQKECIQCYPNKELVFDKDSEINKVGVSAPTNNELTKEEGKYYFNYLDNLLKRADNFSIISELKTKDYVPTKGKKESQTIKKAPIFTYCKVNKNAIEALSLRALYGHEKYEKENDWENFSRVPNGDFEYSNAEFRHALGIGEEDEKTHLVATAWNAVARLELYLRRVK